MPCRYEVSPAAKKHHRHSEHNVEVSKKVLKCLLIYRKPKIFWKTKQHHVAKAKTGNSNFLYQISLTGLVLFFDDILQAYQWLITYIIKQFNQLLQAYCPRVETYQQLFFQ